MRAFPRCCILVAIATLVAAAAHAYPAVLLLTGDNDGRVDPYMSRKMAARLQAANASKHPILLCVSFTSGHGMGTALSERVEEAADVYTFLFQQLGMAQ